MQAWLTEEEHWPVYDLWPAQDNATWGHATIVENDLWNRYQEAKIVWRSVQKELGTLYQRPESEKSRGGKKCS